MSEFIMPHLVAGAADAFETAVPITLGSFLSAHGFELEMCNPVQFNATTEKCVVSIYLSWCRVGVAIGPRPAGSHTAERLVNLEFILAGLAPDERLPGCYRRADQIKAELDRIVEVMRKYCERILLGDFSDWEQFEQMAHEAAMKTRCEREAREGDLKRLAAKDGTLPPFLDL